MSEFCICQYPRPAGDTLKCITCDLQVLQTPVLPPTIAELCRQVLQLCKDAGCHSVDLKLSPNWQSGFHGQVQVQWGSGRHGVPASCTIRTELLTHLEV